MSIQDIQEYLKPQMQQVESIIEYYLRSNVELLDATNRQLRERPGKMLRPMLSLLVAGACGTPTRDTARFAAAAELLHNATLLHDDVVDGATERRGRPTVAQILSSPAAVLIGDYWLTRCMQVILSADKYSERVLRTFATTLGHLSEGEMLQMQKASQANTTEEDYITIIFDKTASLFETAAISAAISVDATEEMLDGVKSYARKLGLAFQIKDDIFDYAPPSRDLGKPVGQDLREQKITQPLLCALSSAPAEEERRIRTLIGEVADHPEQIPEVVEFVGKYNGVEQAVGIMDSYINAALQSLTVLPPSREKEALCELAHYVGNRNL